MSRTSLCLKALTKWPTWKKLLLEFIAGKIGMVRLLENQETGGVQTEHPEGRVRMWGTAHFSFTSHVDSRVELSSEREGGETCKS